MTVSIGTFDDLQPDKPQPIDRNPNLSCVGPCGESYNWLDYWKPRMMLRDDPRECRTICDDCLEKAIKYHDRVTKNKQLGEYND